MGLFLDIFTGRIFNFRNAKGSDINAGGSDRLIVTPKALSESEVYCNTSIPLVFTSPFVNRTVTFSPTLYHFVIPNNGYLFPKRNNKVRVQICANVIADTSCKGEICIWDIDANAPVPNTNFSFTNTNWTIANSNLFLLNAGKTYTLALRKVSGKVLRGVHLWSATLTIQIPVQ